MSLTYKKSLENYSDFYTTIKQELIQPFNSETLPRWKKLPEKWLPGGYPKVPRSSGCLYKVK